MLCLKRWLFDFSAPSFVMIWPTFSSALNCSSALKSFMKRDKTWRIGRSSKKWSAMNFRASAWSNRNLVTRRKICNFIPSFWEKENERKAEKSEGICFKQTLLLMTEDCILSYKLWCWAWYCQAKKGEERSLSKGNADYQAGWVYQRKMGGLLFGVGVRLDYYEERTTEEGEWLGWLPHKKPAATLLLIAPLSEQLHVLQGLKTFESSRKGSSRWIIESD